MRGDILAVTRPYNAILQQGLQIIKAMHDDPRWNAARDMLQKAELECQKRSAAFLATCIEHGYSANASITVSIASHKPLGRKASLHKGPDCLDSTNKRDLKTGTIQPRTTSTTGTIPPTTFAEKPATSQFGLCFLAAPGLISWSVY